MNGFTKKRSHFNYVHSKESMMLCRIYPCRLIAFSRSRIPFCSSICEEPRLCVNQLNEGIERRRVPLQDEDHPGNDPHLVPGFPRLCSGLFPERFRSASLSVGSEQTRLI